MAPIIITNGAGIISVTGAVRPVYPSKIIGVGVSSKVLGFHRVIWVVSISRIGIGVPVDGHSRMLCSKDGYRGGKNLSLPDEVRGKVKGCIENNVEKSVEIWIIGMP